MRLVSPKGAIGWFLGMPFLGMISPFFIVIAGALRWREFLAAFSSSSVRILAVCLVAYGIVIVGSSLAHEFSRDAFSGSIQYLIPSLALLCIGAFPARAVMSVSVPVLGVLLFALGIAGMTFEVGFDYLKYGTWDERAEGFSKNPLVLSGMLVPVSIWVAGAKGARFDRDVLRAVVIPLVTVFAIAFLSAARMSLLVYVTLMPLLGCMLWVTQPRLRAWIAVTLGVLAVGAIGAGAYLITYDGTTPALVRFSVLAKTIWHLEMSNMDYSMSIRAEMYRAGLTAIGESPLFGYGAHAESWAFGQYMPEGTRTYEHVHNQYMSFVLQAGLPGLVAGTAFILAPILAHVRGRDQERSLFSICCVLVLVANFALQGLTDSLFSDVRILWFYGLASCFLLAWFRKPNWR